MSTVEPEDTELTQLITLVRQAAYGISGGMFPSDYHLRQHLAQRLHEAADRLTSFTTANAALHDEVRELKIDNRRKQAAIQIAIARLAYVMTHSEAWGDVECDPTVKHLRAALTPAAKGD